MYKGVQAVVEDRRVTRTRRALAEALIKLTLEKGYELVTIRDVTDTAGVGYATFFRHYPDKDALLQDVLEVVLDELLGLLRTPADPSDAGEVGTLLFQFVERNGAVCRVLLSSRGSATLVGRMVAAGTANAIAQNAPRPGSLVPMDVAAHHLVASSISLIRWWLDHQMPYPAAQMGQVYAELIARPTQAVAFAAPPCAERDPA